MCRERPGVELRLGRMFSGGKTILSFPDEWVRSNVMGRKIDWCGATLKVDELRDLLPRLERGRRY